MELKLMTLLLLFIAGALGYAPQQECKTRTSDCPRRAGFANFTVTDMFNMFTGDLNELTRLCFNNVDALMPLPYCVGNCIGFFGLSKYAYLLQMCRIIPSIREGAHCWDSNFVRAAIDCYDYHYPSWRTGFYPYPMREYNRESIVLACFPDDPVEDCWVRKGDIMFNLMPSFYGRYDE